MKRKDKLTSKSLKDMSVCWSGVCILKWTLNFSKVDIELQGLMCYSFILLLRNGFTLIEFLFKRKNFSLKYS